MLLQSRARRRRRRVAKDGSIRPNWRETVTIMESVFLGLVLRVKDAEALCSPRELGHSAARLDLLGDTDTAQLRPPRTPAMGALMSTEASGEAQIGT